jgi:glycosyltransferase involved in cell wall biosynthesis
VISNADYFVMVSKKEAFGLVYLEAMGKGLISIGTKGQGIDGVIRDAENGFLCESQNPEMLSEKIKKLVALPIDEKIKISVAAQQTTANMTDMKMAEYYINSVKNL